MMGMDFGGQKNIPNNSISIVLKKWLKDIKIIKELLELI
jgi:hypothetical protein